MHGHMSGIMKSGVLQRSISIVSRARCAGAVLLEREHISRNTLYCRQKFLEQNFPVLGYCPLIFPPRSTNIISVHPSFNISTDTISDWLKIRDAACAQQSSRWDILLSQRTGHVKTASLRIWWGSDSKNLLICEPDKVNNRCLKSDAAALRAVNGQID